MSSFESKLDKKVKLSRVFTPATPVSRREAFSGRFDQINAVVNAIFEPGRHVVLYGERGVGKTSMANILSELLSPATKNLSTAAVRITCNADDTYKSIWRRLFRALNLAEPTEWQYGDPNPDEVREILASLPSKRVMVLDEYDRVDDDASLSKMADTIKTLSDHAVDSKLVIVGVSDSIEALIGEHESVARAIQEVQMPRMSSLELMQVVTRGFHGAGMEIADDALIRITKISEGLPTYAHLLALKSGHRAIDDDRTEVALSHVDAAIADVLDSHVNRSTFQRAVQSSHSDALYVHVLVACALAEKDQLGYFSAGSVRDPLSRIMGKPYDIPAFARHLSAFMEQERGAVLQRRGPERSFRYRFRDPLLQPYALLSGIAAEIIPDEYVVELFAPDPEIDWDALLRKLVDDDEA